MSTPTVNVTFGAGSGESGQFYKIWLDDTLNIDADGNVLSNFYKQDAWFLLQVEPGYVPDQVFSSYGMVSDHGPVRRSMVQDGVVWSADDSSVELDCYPAGAVSAEWIGNQVGLAPVSGRTLAAVTEPFEGIARANLSYSVSARLFCWHNPKLTLDDEQEYPAEIMITLKEGA